MLGCEMIKFESSSDRLMCEYPLLSNTVGCSLRISSLHIVFVWEHSGTEEDHDNRYHDHHLDEGESGCRARGNCHENLSSKI